MHTLLVCILRLLINITRLFILFLVSTNSGENLGDSESLEDLDDLSTGDDQYQMEKLGYTIDDKISSTDIV